MVKVEVDVATARPPIPAHIRTAYVLVEAPTETEAELLACQIVACHPAAVMPTGSRILDVWP